VSSLTSRPPGSVLDGAAPVRPEDGLASSVSVAYAGRDGAHGASACERLFPGDARIVPLPSFAAVVDAAVAGDVQFGVLPIESSLSGPVSETHDLLHASPLSIADETVLRIRHHLAGVEDVPLTRIRIVRSHPVALDQCRRLLASMPWATAIAAGTTAEAAAEVAERGDPAEAAIAGERAVSLYDLRVLADDVGDHPEAYTRFVSVATHTRLDSPAGEWRTAFSFVTDHRPGALHRAIEPFARHGIDLVQLVSRPIPETPWRYCFHAVLAGHPLDLPIRDALAEVRAQARRLKLFGSYPAAEVEA
jgi:chorismate mutase/prephenate dehydratase